MSRSVILLILLLSAGMFFLSAQQSQGLEPVPDGLNQSMPQASPRGIVTEENAAPGNGSRIEALPSRVDLREFLPPVKNQGAIGSCSAWSTVYYAKTIQENQERGWGAASSDHQYSPLFTYNQITRGVNKGTSIVDHMILIEKQGAAPLSSFPHTDDINILPDKKVLAVAGNYRAVSHRNLDQYNSKSGTWSVDLQTVKTALAEGLPVVGGFHIYENFYDYKGGIYNRTGGKSAGGHAMCIVGYDDKKAALLIVNSWGAWWGDEGFLWLDYDLFEPLCTYNCAVMYDEVDNVPDLVSAPVELEGSRGVYSDRIELSWSPVVGADFYLLYKVNNQEGVLKEIARMDNASYTDSDLPPGVSYVYAVKSGKSRKTGSLLSDFSEITEGWTGEEKSPPGIPSGLRYAFYRENPVLNWNPVDKAEGYSVYRWDSGTEDFLLLGRSSDSSYMDRSFTDIPEAGIIYYIVQAFNDFGEGYATDSLSILIELPEKPPEEEISPVTVWTETADDVVAEDSEQTSFEGEYYRTDYFDYEYTMARFREYYEKEMAAFRDFQQEEKDSFEEWKKQNESWRSSRD